MNDNVNYDDEMNQIENVVEMQNVSSYESIMSDGNIKRRVLENMSLTIKKSEVWAITGDSLFDILTALQIMSNIKPYADGKCRLVERGMMRQKKKILPHVFYIGNPEMVYNNMNVLEFLMFVTAKSKLDAVQRQDQIFESLVRIGLGNISLTPINTLTNQHKAVISLIAAAYSDSVLIILNLPDYKYDDALVESIGKIAEYIKRKGKSLVIGTRFFMLIEKVCSHISVLASGETVYNGTVKDFRHRYDRAAFTVKDNNLEEIKGSLENLLPQYDYEISDDTLTVSNYTNEKSSPALFYQKLNEAGIAPKAVIINTKSVENAYMELMKKYDIQK